MNAYGFTSGQVAAVLPQLVVARVQGLPELCMHACMILL